MATPVSPTEIDALPPHPSRGDPAPVFVPTAQTFVAALPGFGDQVNAIAAQTYQNAQAAYEAATDLAGAADAVASASNLFARSTSTLPVGAGTKTIHFLNPATGFVVTDQVVILLRSDPSIRMFGTVATFDGSDDMTVNVVSSGVFGSGSYSNWLIMHAAFLTAGADLAEERAGVTEAASSTPGGQVAAMAMETLTDAATVAWDTAVQGPNAKVTLGGDRTIGAPSNLKDGLVYSLTIDPATYTPAYNAIFNFGAAGPPSLPANVWSKLSFQYDEDRGELDVVGVFRGA